jgi:hypothetical protein
MVGGAHVAATGAFSAKNSISNIPQGNFKMNSVQMHKDHQ